jgi:TPP-dependent 2-oxoacid decarboxylase
MFLDSDGVLADFAGAAQLCIGFDGKDFANLSANQMSEEQKEQQRLLFKYIDENPMFFEYEEPYYYAQDLYKLCKNKFDDVKILSSYVPPKEKPEVLDEVRKIKTDWIQKNIDKNLSKNDIIVTDRPKCLYSGASKWLLDDMQRNIDAWVACFGNGVLFNDWEHVKKTLEKIK